MKKLLSLIMLGLLSMSSNSQSVCDSLEFVSVQLNALNPEYITIRLNNETTELFDYPGFRIYDEDDNLIGEEQVFFFGIGVESVHEIPHNLSNISAGEQISLKLELWTGFYDTLACTFEGEYELIPDDACANINLSFSQSWPDQVQENYLVSIFDQDGEEVFNEFYEFPTPDFVYYDEACLDQGCYEMTITTDDAVITNTLFLSLSEYFSSVFMTDSASAGSPFVTINFGIWAGCDATDIDNGNTLDGAPLLYPNPARTWVMLPMDSESVEIFSTSGEKVITAKAENRRLDVALLASGQYIVLVARRGKLHRYRLVKY